MEKLICILERRVHKLKVQRISRRIVSLSVVMALVVSMLAMQPAQKAAAASTDYTPVCSTVYNTMSTWDWVTKLRAISGFSAWNLNDYSYIIEGVNASNGSPMSNPAYQVYWVTTSIDTAHQMHLFMKDPSTGDNTEYDYMAGTGNSAYSFIVHTPTTIGDSANETVTLQAGPFSMPQSSYSNFSSGYGSDTCYAAVHNVVYDSTFSHYQYSSAAPAVGVGTGSTSGTPTSSSCGTLDVTCYVNNAIQSVVSTYQSVVQAVLQGLGDLFLPNGSQLSSDWTSFYNTLYNKLGFLTWPFSFVTGLFTAIVTPSTSCCTIAAGTFMGAHFNGFDLTYVSTHIPSLWTFFTDLVKGMTVLILIFALRNKFLELTTK